MMQGWVNPSFGDFEIQDVRPSPPKKKQSRLLLPSSKKTAGKTQTRRLGHGEVPSWRRKVDDSIPWAEKHAPQSQTELAVHKKKVAEVEDWLRGHLRRVPYQIESFILLLTGPAGVGKTATVNTLAKEMKLTVQEWLNPSTDVFEKDDFFNNTDYSSYPKYMSQTAKFEEFVLRANKYQPLQLGEGEVGGKILLIEDIPNKFYRDPKLFHHILTRFSKTTRCPLVFVISDTHSRDINVQSLFPKDLIASLRIHQISFNPVAPTSVSKVLTRIAASEATKGRHKFSVPCKSTIDAIAQVSSGDIRSAINALQFACLKDTGDLGKVLENCAEPKPKRKPSKSGTASKRKEKSGRDGQLSAIGGKDTSLFLFRALGKILYCKREPKSLSDPKLPPHLAHEERDKLLFNPEEVVERTHMTSENFTLYLHQNYLEFFSDIDDVTAVSDRFSEADHLSCEWEHRSILNQYSSSIATRGLIHHNTARRFHDSPSGGGWRPLHKPEWFEINRKYRDRCATAKALFIGEHCTPVDLQTQVLPYLALADVPLHNPAQISFLQDVGYFSMQHFDTGGKRLNEKDLDEDDCADDSIPSSQTRKDLQKPEITSDQADAIAVNDGDDIIIEEFLD